MRGIDVALAVGLLLLATPAPARGAEPEAESSVASEDDDGGDWRVLTGSIVMGVGIAAIMAGSTVATVAAAEYGSLDCPEDTCPPELADDAEDYNALREPSGLTIAAGGLLSAIGGAFLYAAITDRDVTAVLSPQFVGVRGRF